NIGDRLTEANLRNYIAALRKRVVPRTVVTQLQCLSLAIGAMEPTIDRSLLKLAICRLQPTATPSRNKSAQLKSPTELLSMGLRLMETWQARQAHDPRLNAMDFRDGLMIAFLSLCPIRLKNLAQMLIGRHLTFEATTIRVVFEPHETKGGKLLEFDF